MVDGQGRGPSEHQPQHKATRASQRHKLIAHESTRETPGMSRRLRTEIFLGRHIQIVHVSCDVLGTQSSILNAFLTPPPQLQSYSRLSLAHRRDSVWSSIPRRGRPHPNQLYVPFLDLHYFRCLYFTLVGLNGYEVVSTASPDYNAVPWLWFYHFIPKPKPGSLCDPYRLDIGESFITNYGIFPWTLRNVLPQPNATNQGRMSSNIYYKGESLVNCRLTTMTLELDEKAATIGAEVWCPGSTNPFVIGTQSTLAGVPSTTEGPFSTGGHSLSLDASTL